MTADDEYSVIHKVTFDASYSDGLYPGHVRVALYETDSTTTLALGSFVQLETRGTGLENTTTVAIEVPTSVTGNYRVGIQIWPQTNGRVNLRNWSTVVFLTQGLDRISEMRDVTLPPDGYQFDNYKLQSNYNRWSIVPNLSVGQYVFYQNTDRNIVNFLGQPTSGASASFFSFFYSDVLARLLATGDYSLKYTSKIVVRGLVNGGTFRIVPRYANTAGNSVYLQSPLPAYSNTSTTSDTTLTLSGTINITNPELFRSLTYLNRASITMEMGTVPHSSQGSGVVVRKNSFGIIYLKAT